MYRHKDNHKYVKPVVEGGVHARTVKDGKAGNPDGSAERTLSLIHI